MQLAIHTDGLNEALSVEDTLAAFGGRTVHAFHIEGCGGGHAPDLLALAGRERVLTSSTTPTVPFGVARGGRAPRDGRRRARARRRAARRRRARAAPRVRAATMAAEGVLHDLGVIPMLSSDSQGMGRVGEVVRRAFQNAAAMKRAARRRARARPTTSASLRHLAKVTINPAITHGLAAHVGSLQPGRLADAVLWCPQFFARAARARAQGGHRRVGRLGRRQRDDDARRAGARRAARSARTGAAPARLSLAFLARAAMDAELPTTRPRARRRGLPRAHRRRHGAQHRRGDVRVDPARTR